jgi:hypothetical protein
MTGTIIERLEALENRVLGPTISTAVNSTISEQVKGIVDDAISAIIAELSGRVTSLEAQLGINNDNS